VPDEYLGDEASPEDLKRAIVGLVVLLRRVSEAACKIKPDLMPEEILMDAASDDAIRLLDKDFANVEYTVDDSGQRHVDLASLSIFAKVTPLDRRALDGFIQRRLTPLLKDIFESRMSESEESYDHPEVSADDQPTSHKVNLVGEAEMGELIADPFEGFDEEQEYFERTDYQRFMNGDSLDEILRDDPSEPDYRIGESWRSATPFEQDHLWKRAERTPMIGKTCLAATGVGLGFMYPILGMVTIGIAVLAGIAVVVRS